MSAVLIRTSPGPLRAAWRAARIAFLRLLNWLDQGWHDDCARSGLHTSVSLDDLRKQIQARRCRIAELEQSA